MRLAEQNLNSVIRFSVKQNSPVFKFIVPNIFCDFVLNYFYDIDIFTVQIMSMQVITILIFIKMYFQYEML